MESANQALAVLPEEDTDDDGHVIAEYPKDLECVPPATSRRSLDKGKAKVVAKSNKSKSKSRTIPKA
ncbi:unnamed protein product [Discula destructiva]